MKTKPHQKPDRVWRERLLPSTWWRQLIPRHGAGQFCGIKHGYNNSRFVVRLLNRYNQKIVLHVTHVQLWPIEQFENLLYCARTVTLSDGHLARARHLHSIELHNNLFSPKSTYCVICIYWHSTSVSIDNYHLQSTQYIVCNCDFFLFTL